MKANLSWKAQKFLCGDGKHRIVGQTTKYNKFLCASKFLSLPVFPGEQWVTLGLLPGLEGMLSSGGTETSQGQPFARDVHMYFQGCQYIFRL